MKSNIKIIFMGTPEFSVPSLEAVTKNFEVVSVYSQPPKNSGRGLKKESVLSIVLQKKITFV